MRCRAARSLRWLICMPYADPRSPEAIASQRRRSRKYYDGHKESEKARSSKWLRENGKRVNELAVVRRSKKLPPSQVLFNNAKSRAKAQGLSFDLEVSDLAVPSVCPVLGIPLAVSTGFAKAGSPSVDRIDPTRGYVKGNVAVISHKANTIKSDSTVQEIRAVLAYMERFCAK